MSKTACHCSMKTSKKTFCPSEEYKVYIISLMCLKLQQSWFPAVLCIVILWQKERFLHFYIPSPNSFRITAILLLCCSVSM